MKKINLSILAIFIVLILASTSVLAYSMDHSRINRNYMNNYYNMDGMHHTMNLNNMDHNSYSSTHNRYSSMHYSPNLMQNKINMGWLQ